MRSSNSHVSNNVCIKMRHSCNIESTYMYDILLQFEQHPISPEKYPFLHIWQCYREDLLWLGVDHNRHDDTRNKPISNHAKHIRKTNTKGPMGRTLFRTFEVDPCCTFNQFCTYTFPSTTRKCTRMIYVKHQYLIYPDIFQYIIKVITCMDKEYS